MQSSAGETEEAVDVDDAIEIAAAFAYPRYAAATGRHDDANGTMPFSGVIDDASTDERRPHL